jgi:hypothetical protein
VTSSGVSRLSFGMTLRIEPAAAGRDEDHDIIHDGLIAFNDAASGRLEYEPLCVRLCDPDGGDGGRAVGQGVL